MPNLKANKWLYFQVPFLLLFWFIYLTKVIKKEKIDTIHAHWIIPQWFLAVLVKKIFFPKIKTLGTSHGSDIFWLQGKTGSYLKRFTLKNIDTLTVVSQSIKQEVTRLGNFPNLEIDIIPMWVDDTQFYPEKYNNSIREKYGIEWIFLLFVGRLAEVKWIEYLIRAIPGILQKYPNIKLLIVGSWNQEDSLKNETKSLWLEETIIFAGAIPNQELPVYFATADIFIWPSIRMDDGAREGFGLTFVEAILSGCITLWTNVAGITDIIEDGKTGFLIKEKDSKDIEEKIIQCIENKNFDTNNAREIIKNKFSWDIVSQKYYDILIK